MVLSPTDPAGRMMARLAAGEVRVLARAISLVEDEHEDAPELLAACDALNRRALRIGITGAPGAGKSTLIEAMIRHLRAAARNVAVLAFDPSSPLTGGALLGDRVRMPGFSADPGVYLRSMSSRGAPGGLGRAAAPVCRLMEAAGWSTILVETVGIGQAEVAVAGLVDVTLMLLVPGLGDDIQTLKAGVMEIADIFVLNKSDGAGAELVAADIRTMQALVPGSAAWLPPVVRTVATAGDGIPELMAAIERCVALRAEGKR